MTILVTGPESSGKTTLALNLAWALDGVYVAEAARDYLEERKGDYNEADLPEIWAKQKEAEDAARASSASFVVCDTGPGVVRVWAEVKYGRCPEKILLASEQRAYDLVLLCRPDLPWEPDPLRETPDHSARLALFDHYQEVLSGREVVIIDGQNRLGAALRSVIHAASLNW
jgi:nicotinamide riboside kinase